MLTIKCLPLWGKWIEMRRSVQKNMLTAVSSPVGEVD